MMMVAVVVPFHTILSERLPCVQNGCKKTTLPGHYLAAQR